MHQVRFPGESQEQRRARALRERVDDLRSARERIIAAADEERRRIQRDLHDGAQQRLVSLALMLSLAESRMATDPEAATKLIHQARAEAQQAIDELRELAGGIHPAVLSDHGLGPALEALASRAPLPVQVRCTLEGTPLRPAVEAAAYFVTSEALANVAKYAQASEASVAVSLDDDRLHLDVSDDGVGGADPAKGSGLNGLRDRIDALDGRLEIESPPGVGTTLRIEIPMRPGR
jgi:signal transduction histidine kinase